MHLKHFTAVPQPVPDPMRPNRTVNVTRLIDSGAQSHSEPDRVYYPDVNGWFDFPHEVAERLRRFRNHGSGWFAVGEVADAVRLGTLEQMDMPATSDAPRRTGRPPKSA